jgi:hypothetical protein
MTAPVGAVVGIFYDAPRAVAQGDVLVTRTGRTYLVVSARKQKRGTHVGRWHLRCLVQSAPPLGARIHPLHWYPRGRRTPPRS